MKAEEVIKAKIYPVYGQYDTSRSERISEAVLDALRAACGGGDIVIRTDGTLATLSLNYREVGTYVTIDSYVVVPVEREG